MRKRRPSPAMVVAIIALFFSLAGTGVATISALTKTEKKQTRGIAASEVEKLAPGLTVRSAGFASAAGSADLINGHNASCPPNTFLSRGLCFEDSTRTATAWGAASDQCASAGGMLPSLDQLRPTRTLPGVNLGADDASANWTSNIGEVDTSAGGSTGVSALAVKENGGIIVNTAPFTTDQHPFRCVFALLR